MAGADARKRKPRPDDLKKVLIITYYWPPNGGVAVQRWLKFSKYLPEFGWEPIVYTPENPEIPLRDDTLEAQIPESLLVVKQPVWEPYDLYRTLLGKKNERIGAGLRSTGGKEGWGKGVGIWIRGNLFIPDPRKFWVKPSVKYLSKFVENNGIQHVITTGPPHSMHLIGLGLKKQVGIKWIADFRDPWTNIEFYQDLKLTRLADRKHHQLEKQVVTGCDHLITVSPSWAQDFERLGAQKADVVYNGYDSDDFSSEPLPDNDGFTLAHIGSFSVSRNHPNLWQAVQSLKTENPDFDRDFQLLTLGQVDQTIGDSIANNGLKSAWKELPHRPHGEVMEVLRGCGVQLLVVNELANGKGRLPSKLYEYLASGRPILCVGPTDGDAARIISETNSGICVSPSDQKGIKEALQQLYTERKSPSKTKNIEQFSRKYQAGNVAEILNQLSD